MMVLQLRSLIGAADLLREEYQVVVVLVKRGLNLYMKCCCRQEGGKAFSDDKKEPQQR